MSNKIHKVSQDLKNQILERVKTSGKSIKEIATEHGITTTCIYNKRGGVKTSKASQYSRSFQKFSLLQTKKTSGRLAD